MSAEHRNERLTPRQITLRLQHKLEAFWRIPGDDSSADRLHILKYNVTANVIANLIGGNFFTGLLLLLNADNGFFGLMTIITFSVNLLQLFAPFVLERFERRKKLLISLRVMLHAINIVLIGLIPLIPADNQARLAMVALSVFLVNALNALMGPGYSVWHIAHIPPRVRVSFFSLLSMLNGIFVAVCNLVASRVVDAFKASGNELLGLEVLRIVALLIAVYDILLLCRLRELPRSKPVSKINFRDLLTKPWKERVYLRTVLVVVLWNATANLPGSYYTVYLLSELNVSYSYITLISMFNVVILILLTPVWRRFFNRKSWLKPLSWGILMLAPYYFMLAFVSPNLMVLYPIATIWAFICLTGINLAFTSVAYINIPQDNQTLYIGFYSTMAYLGALVGAFLARTFVTSLEGLRFTFLGVPFGEKQLLMIITGTLMFGAGFAVRGVFKKNLAEKVEV
jgi:MFS family permease